MSKLQPRISELSKRPITSKEPSLYTFPRSCVAMKAHELMISQIDNVYAACFTRIY
jgi:hypothetical protein